MLSLGSLRTYPNMYNDYFVDIGKNIAESIGGNNNNHLDYMVHINQPCNYWQKTVTICEEANVCDNTHITETFHFGGEMSIYPTTPCIASVSARLL